MKEAALALLTHIGSIFFDRLITMIVWGKTFQRSFESMAF
jgi:hypothetical protein